MSEWTSRITEHRIWNLMKDYGPILDDALKIDDIEPTTEESIRRLKAVLTLSGKRLGAAEPLTVSPSALDSIAGAMETQKSEIAAFITDRNPAHVVNANVAADTVSMLLAQIPSIERPEELISLMQAVTSYRTSIEEQMRASTVSRSESKAQIDSLTAGLAQLQGQLEGERQKIAAQAAEYQKAFADAQDSRSKTFGETILKIQENLTKTLSDQQGQFSVAQENRNAQFTSAERDSQKRFADLLADYTKRLSDRDTEFGKEQNAATLAAQEKLSELNESYQREAKKILEKVNQHREEVEKLVGVIGTLGVTSGYQTTANRSRHSMWFWQGVTVAAMCGLVYFAYRAFLPSIQADFRWESFAARVFLTITVGVLAAYAGTQADRFFHMEKSNRKLALELAAIDPFIALLPQDEQYKFKLEIGRRSFAQEEAIDTRNERSPATTLDLLSSDQMKQFLELVAAVSKIKGTG
jgi:hypothetical protein